MAPLLTAGLASFIPLRKFADNNKSKIISILGCGVVGLLAVKISKAFGYKVLVFSRSKSKKKAAVDAGADDFIVEGESSACHDLLGKSKCDVLLDTIPVDHQLSDHLAKVKKGGHYVLLGRGN